MDLTTLKKWSGKVFAGFLNDNSEPTLNIEGVVEIAGVSDLNVDINSVTAGTTYVGKVSTATGRDFTATWLATETITLSGYPPGVTGFIGDDIEFVRQIRAGEVIATYNRDDAVMDITTHVLTVTGMVSVTGDTFVIMTNVPRDDAQYMSPSVNSSCYIGKSAALTNGDFIAEFSALETITFTGYPADISAITAGDIESVRQINAAGSVVATYHRDDVVMTMTGAVLTVPGATFLVTDVFVVFTNIPVQAVVDVITGTTYVGKPVGAVNEDFTTAYASGTTITLGAYPENITEFEAQDIEFVRRINASGVLVHTHTRANSTFTIAGNVLTIAEGNFDAADTFIVVTNVPRAASNYLEESIADITNVATGTYYPAATGMPVGIYKNLSVTGKLIDGAAETTTLTIEATNDEDTGGDWVQINMYDVKNDAIVNSVAATNETMTYALMFDSFNFLHVRFLITATAATNTVIIKLRRSN